ncbi:MAG: cell filamentation protein Fic [Clostridiales bacterium]|nr:cell filamentation protein Fic [Clostridiales bacterium]
MYELYESRNSIYCYPNSNVLKNKFDIQDNDKLFEIERKIVLAKLYELRQNNQIFNFDIHHFVGIHEFLFEDIYPFAGLFRTENIAKGNFSFAQWQFIDKELIKLLNELKEENYLKGLNIKDMAKRLAYYMAELNVLHPFREGNGRTIREFTRQIAFNAGYILDTQNINATEILNACIKSVVDPTDLENILLNCLSLK